MGFFEILEKIEDWLDKSQWNVIEMSETDYADVSAREYWELVYNAHADEFTSEQVSIIEDAFNYNYSVPILPNGEPATPRIITVNLMHPEYNPKLLRTMTEAMKMGVNLKTCSIKPNRWREAVFDTLVYGFHKGVDVIENSNNYNSPELRGIIDAKVQGISLMQYMVRHEYGDCFAGDQDYKDIQSGTLKEKDCLKRANALNKRNFYDTYELHNLTEYIKSGGEASDFVDAFCKNQHIYSMTYLKDGQLVNNKAEVEAKDAKMKEFIKEFQMKHPQKKPNTMNNKPLFSVYNTIKNSETPTPTMQKPKEQTEPRKLSKLEEFLKEETVIQEEFSFEEAEAEILSYYNRD